MLHQALKKPTNQFKNFSFSIANQTMDFLLKLVFLVLFSRRKDNFITRINRNLQDHQIAASYVGSVKSPDDFE